MLFSAREYLPKGYSGLVCALAAEIKPAHTEQPPFCQDASGHEFVAGSCSFQTEQSRLRRLKGPVPLSFVPLSFRLSRFHVPRFQSSLPGRARCLVVFSRGRSKKFRTYFNIDIAATTGIGAVSAREIGRKPKLFDRVPAHLQGRKVDRSVNRPPLVFPNKAGASSFVTAHG